MNSQRLLRVESLERRLVLDAAGMLDLPDRPLLEEIDLNTDDRPDTPRDKPPGDDNERPKDQLPPDRGDDFRRIARRTFVAPLSGRQEVPEVESRGHGITILRLNDNGSELHFRLRAVLLEDVKAAHLHLGARGTNGPILATLFPTASDNETGKSDDPAADLPDHPAQRSKDQVGLSLSSAVRRNLPPEVEIPPGFEIPPDRELPPDFKPPFRPDRLFVAHGTLTNDDVPAQEGFEGGIRALVKEILAGNVYVNVHTAAHPSGEIRGQVLGLNAHPGHNPKMRWDVNGDSLVTPGDALRVINDLNLYGSRKVELPSLAEMDARMPSFMDVNGDNMITPADALHIFNHLNYPELVDATHDDTGGTGGNVSIDVRDIFPDDTWNDLADDVASLDDPVVDEVAEKLKDLFQSDQLSPAISQYLASLDDDADWSAVRRRLIHLTGKEIPSLESLFENR